MQKRIAWLDSAKGWGILLVMIGHTVLTGPLSVWIYSFHLPLFFFVSGYLFHPEKYATTLDFIKSRARSLLIPYLSFSLIILAFDFCKQAVKPLFGRKAYYSGVINQAIGILAQVRNTPYSGVCWFLTLLFLSQLLLYLIVKISERRLVRVAGLLLLFFAIGCQYMKAIGKPLPWHIDASWIAVIFVGAGYLARMKNIDLAEKAKWYAILAFGIISVLSTAWNYKIAGVRSDLYSSQIGNPVLYFIAAFSGMTFSLLLIRIMPNFRAITYIGLNSLIYYTLHATVFYPMLNPVIQKALKLVTHNSVVLNFGQAALCVSAACLLMVPVCYAVNNWFPFLLGKRRTPKEQKI